VPPQNGWTVDDLFTLPDSTSSDGGAMRDGYIIENLFMLPDLPRHVELIDGKLVTRAPQQLFHADTVDLLVQALRGTLPGELRVRREMTVVLDGRNAPEPDVSVIHAVACGPDRMCYQAADVVLAVEVVSPDSESRDRTTKPHKYAAAGIPHFWRVERNGDTTHPVVHTYTIDPLTKAYVHTGMHRDQLKVNEPYDITVDLTAVDQL
jgi:Uma2 family endonuclease